MSRRTGPAVPEVGILALVPDHWGPYWQPRHYVLSALARFFPVAWVEPAMEARGFFARPAGAPDPPPPPGLLLHDSRRWPPKIYRPAALARWSARARLAAARARLVRFGCRRIVLYLWRPRFAEALDLVKHDLSCYHVDDEYSFYGEGGGIDWTETERGLLQRVDQVFIHSPALREKKGDLNPHTESAPNGVDFAAYRTPRAEPADLAAIPAPRIGYVGYLKRQLDWDLLGRLVAERPSWSFVFVGPAAPHEAVRRALGELGSRKNVHLLGGRPVGDLPAYSRHFDVCVMPYVVDDYTRYIYPLKLHEFLATGNPVVATRIRSLEEFEDVVRLARTPGEWFRALDAALAERGDETARAARVAVAEAHDWGRITERIALTLARRLSPEIAAKAEAAAAGIRSGAGGER